MKRLILLFLLLVSTAWSDAIWYGHTQGPTGNWKGRYIVGDYFFCQRIIKSLDAIANVCVYSMDKDKEFADKLGYFLFQMPIKAIYKEEAQYHNTYSAQATSSRKIYVVNILSRFYDGLWDVSIVHEMQHIDTWINRPGTSDNEHEQISEEIASKYSKIKSSMISKGIVFEQYNYAIE